jgi:hypothetical protein
MRQGELVRPEVGAPPARQLSAEATWVTASSSNPVVDKYPPRRRHPSIKA